ncbi:MAG: hypothetical protein RIB71_17440 [Imperialibacter sp.]|uniref:hypothetical protein n=1 Tax=Imperialibacter sp. TaxID=2038411 RepID=UPI0032EB0F97
MKKVLILGIFQVLFFQVGFSSIPKIKLESDLIEKALNIYIEKTGLQPDEYSVFFLEIVLFEKNSNNNDYICEFSIVGFGDYFYASATPPSFYTFINKRPVLIYTGIESLALINESEGRKLMRKLRPGKHYRTLKSCKPLGFKVANDKIEVFE